MAYTAHANEGGMPRKIVVLGSTGSIGTQTLDVARRHPDKLEVIALAANSSVDAVLAQAHEFRVRNIAFGNAGLARDARLASAHGGVKVGFGPEAVAALASIEEADVVVNALVGAAGLRASYETLAAGKVLALANNESLVVGGDLIMPMAAKVDAARRAAGVAPATGPAGALMPIDSEHGAIYQCLLGERAEEVSCLWVTASGGPFRGRTRDELRDMTAAQALKHPTWNMGAKITIDSSTLMNKGLEVIEAHHLFNMPYDRIKVVVQPQSAIHSMVEYDDHSVIAQMGVPDMRLPIQYALTWPERTACPVEPLDLIACGKLTFYRPDEETFICLPACREAIARGGLAPAAANGANERAVSLFLEGKIPFLRIGELVHAAMLHQQSADQITLQSILEADRAARQFVDSQVR